METAIEANSQTEIEFDGGLLADGTLVDLIADAENPLRNSFVCYKDGQISYADRLQDRGRGLLPTAMDGRLLRHVRLPRAVREFGSMPQLVLDICELMTRCVSISEQNAVILAHFVLSTWVIDRLSLAPYVALVGMPQSGKTTLLRMLNLVCRRPLLTSDLTAMALCFACDRMRITLLIDEAASGPEPEALRRLLRIANTPESVVLRRDYAWNIFGAKVISWMELPDDAALNSRCLIISMNEVAGPKLERPNDPEIQAKADELQAKLLCFRLANFHHVTAPDISEEQRIRPRLRDLYQALAAPCTDYPDICEWLLEHFTMQNIFMREPLSLEENAVLAALYARIHRNKYNGMEYISDLSAAVSQHFDHCGEKAHLPARRIGAILASMGFTNRRRTKQGWGLLLDHHDLRKIHKIAEWHGIDRLSDFAQITGWCPFCDGTAMSTEEVPTQEAEAEEAEEVKAITSAS